MKRVLFLLLSSLFVGNTMAQTSPVAPTSLEIQTKNSVLLKDVMMGVFLLDDNNKMIYYGNTYIRIPLYLSVPQDVTIKYCWYGTKMAFGEEIRVSEEPEYIEEGMYVNGRLTMYKTKTMLKKDQTVFCKFNWSDNGEIMSVDKYNADGDLIRSYKSENYNVEPKALSDERPTIRSDDRFGVFNADNKVRCEYFEL